ncbi:MAG: hypothetical protein L0H19_01525 [Salinisphaera sp.]|nr:hypothetical protein [Salinisphaera sp.]MDN5938649.1 hypothetical protein [Salinisphaera sp.]
MPQLAIEDSTLVTLDEYVGLKLSAQRREALAPVLNGVLLPTLAALDVANIGETPPDHTFDARWGGKND